MVYVPSDEMNGTPILRCEVRRNVTGSRPSTSQPQFWAEGLEIIASRCAMWHSRTGFDCGRGWESPVNNSSRGLAKGAR